MSSPNDAAPPAPLHPPLPSGHVTFLLTDIEASSQHWEQRPSDMPAALQQHDAIVAAAIAEGGGVVIRHTGDGVNAVFPDATAAVRSALEMQGRLQRAEWGAAGRLKVRVGLHVGDMEPTGNDYFGPPINRAARVMDVANGDQVAVSGDVADEIDGDGIEVGQRGVVRLKGVGRMEIALVTAPGLVVDDRPLRARGALSASRLPADATALIGREAEVTSVVDALSTRRLVSVIGVGGLGKTRVAIAAARRHEPLHEDGVVYVELAPVTEESAVVEAIAHAVGARPQPGLTVAESVVNFLADRDVLLLLDNCEHVGDAVRAVAEMLLRVDGPQILATSRAPLGAAGERIIALGGLESLDSAHRLFVDRALDRGLDWVAEDAQRATVEHICELLGRLPLALELAAAQLRLMSAEDLLARVSDTFPGLVGGDRDVLWDTARWSYDQLTDDAATLFRALGLFHGGFTVAAVAHVADRPSETVLTTLMELVDTAVVQPVGGTGEVRFTMLETLRSFAADALRDDPARASLTERHARFYAAMGAEAEAELASTAEAELWGRLQRDWPNLRAAFAWLTGAEAEADRRRLAVDMLGGVAWFSVFSVRSETFEWARRMLDAGGFDDKDPDERLLLARLWALAAMGAYLGADAAALDLAQRSLALDETDPSGLARLPLAGIALNNTFDVDMGDAVTAAMIDHATPDRTFPYLSAVGMRTFSLCLRDPDREAIGQADLAMPVAVSSGSASAMAIAQWARGLANVGFDWDVPAPAWRAGLDAAESLYEHHVMGGLIRGMLCHFAALLETPEAAAVEVGEAIRRAIDSHYLVGTSHLLAGAAAVLVRRGEADAAGRLIGAMRSAGHRPRRDIRTLIEDALGDRYDDATAAGAHLSITEAGHEALELLRHG